ncbi:MAG: PilZ domain-containing protein [Acidobacteria bacterium]|nr:PilZ domain-containing protein [Acidobacteriota bacterium]
MVNADPGALRPRRYQLFLPLRVWIRTWGKRKPSHGVEPEVAEETITENISSAGCFFLLSKKPEVGSRVDMEIEMAEKPGGKPGSKMVCRGRVVRIEKEKGKRKTGVGCAIDRYRIVPPSAIS